MTLRGSDLERRDSDRAEPVAIAQAENGSTACRRLGRSPGLIFGWLLVASACADPVSARSHTVLIGGFAFAPLDLTVAAGDTVVFRNNDFVAHTATEHEHFDSGSIAEGEEWRWVATPGRHEYECTLHPAMKGAIVVIKNDES